MAAAAAPFSLEELIACVRREVNMRRRVYRLQIREGRMTQAHADREVGMMEAVAAMLERQKAPGLGL